MTARVSNGSRRLGAKKKAELMRLAQEHLSLIQLKDAVPARSYKLTTAGWALLNVHPDVVARYPKKG